MPKILSGIKYIDFSNANIIGYLEFDKLARRILDIKNYNIPVDVKQTRKVKPLRVPNPITEVEKKLESLDTHIIKFLENIEQAKDDSVSAYNLFLEIYNKEIDEKYLPSIYKLYEFRKNKEIIILEENILWGKLFVNIWYNNFQLDEIAIRNVIALIKTKEFFIVRTIIDEILLARDIEEFYIIDEILRNQLSKAFVECLAIKNHI